MAATILSLLVFDHQHRIEKDQRAREHRGDLQRQADELTNSRLQFRDELLKGTLARITTSYNSAKRARRKMRALGLRRTGEVILIRLERYDECMADINDAQLDLEAIKSDVKTSRPAYRSAELLAPSLKSMEQYLGELFEEYEAVRAITEVEGEMPLKVETRLADFLGPSTGSSFSKKFSDAYGSARTAIRSDLLHLSFPPDLATDG